MNPLRVVLSGFFLTWSLFFLAEDVQDFLTGEAYYSAVFGGSFMGALAVYWIATIWEEVY